jgi:hypothetical protein
MFRLVSKCISQSYETMEEAMKNAMPIPPDPGFLIIDESEGRVVVAAGAF